MKILFEYATALPVQGYGGTERIIYWLMKELVRQGHQVSLIGHPESQVEGDGIQLIPRPDASVDFRSFIPRDTDVVHLFGTPSQKIDCAHLVTIQGNGRPGERFIPNTVFISRKHAANHGGDCFVYNGIDLSEYPFHEKKRRPRIGRYLFLAKARWKVKNLRDCVWACRKARVPLEVAGGRAWVPSRYVSSHGMVDQSKKLELLRACDALLFPVRWHEPFGIAIIEALAMGLPVLGSPYGSLPELITQGRGVICANRGELLDGVLNSEKWLSATLNPEAIRAEIARDFSVEGMARRYLELYAKILRGEPLHQRAPQSLFAESAEELLHF